MKDVRIIWDLEDDPDGNFRHITDGHDVTIEEVEEVLRSPLNTDTESRTNGYAVTFGWTSSGKHIAVVWEKVEDDLLALYPIAAYPVPPPRSRRHAPRTKPP